MVVRHETATVRRWGMTEETVVVGDMNIHVWKGGQGPPLLLLHGFGGDGLWTWRGQIRAFAAHHTVIIPDLLWFGGSGTTNGPYTLDRQTDAVIALMDHEGIARTDVVGISYGGFITLSLDQRFPERVGRIVLVDSPGMAFQAADYSALLTRFKVASPTDLFVPTGPDGVRALLDLAWVHPPWIPRPILRDLYKQMFSQHQAAQRALIDDLLGRRDSAMAWTPSGPVLVVWGADDPVFPLAVGQRLAASVGAPILVLPGAAHAPNLDQPEAFNLGVLRFLEGGTGL